MVYIPNDISHYWAARQAQISASRAELSERARYLEKEFGVPVPGFFEYDRHNPEIIKGPSLASMFPSILLFAGVTGLLFGVFSGAVLTGFAAFGITTLLLSGVASIYNPKLEIDNQRNKRYENFLNLTEASLEQVRSRDQLPEIHMQSGITEPSRIAPANSPTSRISNPMQNELLLGQSNQRNY